MSKILKVLEDKIVIGLDGGGVTEVRMVDVNFVPAVGDEVELFTSELTTYVTKKAETVNASNSSPNGINITLQNTQATAQPQTIMVAQGKLVSKVIYIILALFLGGLGVHKFYSGKIGMGIVYILFCWSGVPSVIALVEAIVAAVKPADAQGNIIM